MIQELDAARFHHVPLPLPTHQTGKAQESQQSPVIKTAMLAIGGRALIGPGLRVNRRHGGRQ